jgi:PAS domain S-box-containing protein
MRLSPPTIKPAPPPFLLYSAAIALTFIAFAINMAPPLQELPFIAFFAAVALTARFCGAGPAILCTILSALVADYFLMPPRFAWAFSTNDAVRLLAFVTVCAVIINIATKKSQAERSAVAAQLQTQRVLHSMQEGVMVISRDWTITYINEQGAKLADTTPEEIVGKNLWERYPELRGTELERNYRKVLDEHTVVRFENYYAPVQRWFQLNAYPTEHGLTVFYEDVTARKTAEEALRKSEERFRFGQRAANVGSWEWNIGSDELWWSEGMTPLHGHANVQRTRTLNNWLNLVHAEDREKWQQAIEGALEGKRDYQVEYRTVWPDDSLHWIVARGQVLSDAQGKPEKMTGVAIDITERKLAEEALRKTEKLAATGRLAATIAHEINNPLEAVTNLLYLLRINKSLDGKAQMHLHLADQEIERVGQIAKLALGFYRDTSAPVLVELPQLLDDVLKLYTKKLAAKRVKIEKRYEAAPVVQVLAGEIRQVFSNLIANALDAMPERGRLVLKIAGTRELGNGTRPGVRVTVADTGCGIKPEQMDKLFEPFYTTKKDVGTGLGLWVSREIIRKHRGYIQVRSSTQPGSSGTVFSLFLPQSAFAASELETKIA